MMLSGRILLLAAIANFASVTQPLAAPQRVVSINVCTDQLAMLVADKAQLYSLSDLASDPALSALAAEAGAYRSNHGSAEEVYLMKPDLVLAGTYSARTTVNLLRRMNITVEEFAPATSFDEIRADIRRMGDLLGQSARAGELVGSLDRGIAELATRHGARKTVALSFADNYTSGSGTLANAVVTAAGLENISQRLGLKGIVQLPLEMLLLADPDIIVADAQRFSKPALAEQTYRHPAFVALARRKTIVAIPSYLTACGGPFTLEAVKLLEDATRKGAAR